MVASYVIYTLQQIQPIRRRILNVSCLLAIRLIQGLEKLYLGTVRSRLPDLKKQRPRSNKCMTICTVKRSIICTYSSLDWMTLCLSKACQCEEGGKKLSAGRKIKRASSVELPPFYLLYINITTIILLRQGTTAHLLHRSHATLGAP